MPDIYSYTGPSALYSINKILVPYYTEMKHEIFPLMHGQLRLISIIYFFFFLCEFSFTFAF